MLKALRPLAALIEGLIDRIGSLTAWIALVMIGLVATNVLRRYAFSFGSVWAQELEWPLAAQCHRLVGPWRSSANTAPPCCWVSPWLSSSPAWRQARQGQFAHDEWLKQCVIERSSVVNAILAGDAEAAGREMRTHLLAARTAAARLSSAATPTLRPAA